MNNILNVLTEMVNEASREIGFEVSEGNVEQVLMDLKHNYEIELNADAPITWRIMQILCDAVEEWQDATLRNFV
jgi:hypothetical protein